MLTIRDGFEIPLTEFQFTFSRSSGPGGQNVNKVNTKVTLRWDVNDSPSLPEEVRLRFMEQYRHRLTKEGELLITSQRFRDQGRNVADCLAKLRDLILAVASPPKRRRKTRPTKGSRERRLREKRARSEKKQLRQQPPT